MSGWHYEIRPADPAHRADAPDAHEVLATLHGRPQRVVAVYQTRDYAFLVAGTLNFAKRGQIR